MSINDPSGCASTVGTREAGSNSLKPTIFLPFLSNTISKDNIPSDKNFLNKCQAKMSWLKPNRL